jgi:hypothetical protein
MKVSIAKNNPTRNRPFPKLMQCNDISGLIVLMTRVNNLNGESEGTVVSAGSSFDWKIGAWSNEWAIHLFSDFEGTLELSND